MVLPVNERHSNASILFWGVTILFFCNALQGNAQTLSEALDTSNLVWTTGGDTDWFGETTNTYDGMDAVQSGPVYSNQTSWLETKVVGPATISFWIFPPANDSIIPTLSWRFSINDPDQLQPLFARPLSRSWGQQIYDLGDGTNVLHWTAFGLSTNSANDFIALDEFNISPPRPLTITYQPVDQTVYSGAQISLFTSAIGTPPLHYQWNRDGANIVNGTNAWLFIGPAATNDTGNYFVTVFNSEDHVDSSNVMVTVLPPAAPLFTAEPANVTAYMGQSFQWTVGIDGSPPFTYEWKKDGAIVAVGVFGTNGYGSAALILTNISEEDAGNYQLAITNEYGGVESSNATLTVAPSIAPNITREPRSLDVAQNVNTWMTFAVTGAPNPSVTWTGPNLLPTSPYDSPPPLPSTLPNAYPKHAFNNVTTNDAGIYFATASNYGGETNSWDALLTVLPAITNVGSWTQGALDVYVTNDMAFLARGTNGLTVLDVANPADPVLLGTCDTPGSTSAIRISGGWAFVADGSAGLQIISITNPSNPVIAGHYATSGNAQDLAVRSNMVYLADGNAGLLILNVSNVAMPSLISSYSTNFSPAHICLSENFAYLTSPEPIQEIGSSNNWDGGMFVLDVSDPKQPKEVIRWGGSLETVAARGSLLFAGDSVISLTNPAEPTVIGALDYLANYTSSNTPSAVNISTKGICLVNDLVYTLVGFSDQQWQLIVFDVRDPADPIPVGYYVTQTNASAFWVNDHFIYITDPDFPLEIVQAPFNINPIVSPNLSAIQQPGMNLQIHGRHGLHYDVEFTDQLSQQPWQTLQTLLLTNDSLTIPVSASNSSGFFRLKQRD